MQPELFQYLKLVATSNNLMTSRLAHIVKTRTYLSCLYFAAGVSKIAVYKVERVPLMFILSASLCIS